MKIDDIKKKKLPDTPGVYFFRDSKKSILYIGKAVSLRDRVRSYFGGDVARSRSPLIADLVEKTKTVDVITTDSVLEALILEANLIKKHRPRYNTREKDDKSFNYVMITREEWPRVLTVRGRELNANKTTSYKLQAIYGPFPHGGLFKEAMKIIRKIFPYYDTKRPLADMSAQKQNKHITFNQQIGLYPDPETQKQEYKRTIRHLRLFFEGKKKQLIRQLEREMKSYAGKREFEKANVSKRRLFALNHIQDVSLIKEEFRNLTVGTPKKSFRIESYDIAHMAGHDTVGVMIVVENGDLKKSDYRKFIIRREGISDTAALMEVISRRLGHAEWPLPKLIVVDGGVAQKNVAVKVLKEVGVHIPVVSVVKDEHHRPREILGDKRFRTRLEKDILLSNNEAHRFALSFHRRKRRNI